MNSNSTGAETYDAISRGFHWLMALFVLGMLTSGVIMSYAGSTKAALMPWHQSFGVTVLILAVLRIAWRLSYARTVIAATNGYLLQWLSVISHRLLYLLMLAVPLAGWGAISAWGQRLNLFGVVSLPEIVEKNRNVAVLLKHWHGWLAYALLALVALHMFAVLYHHFIVEDNLIKRMLG